MERIYYLQLVIVLSSRHYCYNVYKSMEYQMEFYDMNHFQT